MPAALLLIDIQKGFDDLAYWGGARNNPDMEANGLKLLGAWRKAGWPVVHVRHASTKANSPLRADQPGHAPRDGYEPIAGEKAIVKSVNSAFIGTDLEAWLRARGISELVVAGITTHQCVSTSVRMAANLGFQVTLAGDACHAWPVTAPDGRNISAETVHDTELAILSGEFARIATTNDLLAEAKGPAHV